MAFVKEHEALEQAISGFGVDEQSVLEIFKGVKIEDVTWFETSTPGGTFVDGVPKYNKTMASYDAERMQASFLHFHKALEMWTMHPYVRDACLMRSAFQGEVLHTNILVEVICTRTSGELLGAKLLYQTMYGTPIEKQLEAYTPQTLEHKLLITMLFIDRYKRNEQEDPQKDVKILFQTLRRRGKNRDVELLTNETIHYIDMVLTEQYKLLNNTSSKKNVDECEIIKDILKCRRDPVSYFVNVIDNAFEAKDVDAFTRVIVTRADNDMRKIKRAYFVKHKISLQQKINDVAKGCYKDFILMLMTY